LKRIQLLFVLIGILCYVHNLSAQYTGSDNDGHSSNIGCIQNLNGTTGLIPGPVIGSTEFCAFATEAYRISESGSTSSTVFLWTAPPGSTITSGQGTNSVLITFGDTDGNVNVDISNECVTINSFLPVTQSSCTFFAGGSNDGFASELVCIQQLDGGPALIPGPIVGSAEFCPFATEAYSITVSGALPSAVYTWSVPPGATITTGQGTSSILITFGGANGTISVDISNECETVNQTLPVTAASCTFFAGGVNDGFSTNVGCIQNLDGGSAFIPGPIVGSTEFCPFATEAYNITVSGALPSAVYTWTVPPGATITAGQGTNSVLITFGGANGTISVDINNECETVNQVLPVTAASCTFFAGGNNDGFTSNVGCIQSLDGGPAFIPGPIAGSTEFCPFATEVYSINVSGATSSTIYTWIGPLGSTITSGQGTSSVVITFGGTDGTISVDISNECETVNQVLPVTAASCTFFAGGNNDGFTTNVGCIQSLDGGSAFIPGPIIGSTEFCQFATEAYAITVAGATSSTVFTWSGPPGSIITAGQGTNSVLITFGGVDGNISVDISNECETVNQLLPVTAASCTFFAGGNNDGFTTNVGCIQSLDGGSAFIPGSIVGSVDFCAFASEAYSITVAGATSSTVYTWSGPPGSTITAGQGTSSVLITFAGANGNVSVNISNACETVPVTLAVSSSSCLFYRGGSNDGFSVTTTVNIPLPIELVSFEALVKSGVVKITWVTASELNNDYFQVEKSQDGKEFLPVLRVEGAGTTNQRKTYEALDESPFPGISYYRLSQTDFDGTKSYSKVAMVRVEGELADILKLYPNPVRKGDVLYLDYFSEVEEVIQVAVVDPSGKDIAGTGILVKIGWNKLSVTPDFMSQGLHVLHLKTQRGDVTLRLMVF